MKIDKLINDLTNMRNKFPEIEDVVLCKGNREITDLIEVWTTEDVNDKDLFVIG